jgi:Na+-translocating ferredoxin:NAD+ oxidoreductase RnfA subunit
MMNPEPQLPPAVSAQRGRTAGLPELAAAIVPSLAAAVTVSAALWLSAAAIVSLLATVIVAALVVDRLPRAAGSLAVLLTAAGLACGADLAASTWLPSVNDALGIYLPLTVIVMSGPVAAAVLSDARQENRMQSAVVRALVAAGAFLGGVGLTALSRETLGAGTVTLPGGQGGRVFRLPGLPDVAARGLLEPFAGLIAAGYVAGLVRLVARCAARRAVAPSMAAARLGPPDPGRTAEPSPGREAAR